MNLLKNRLVMTVAAASIFALAALLAALKIGKFNPEVVGPLCAIGLVILIIGGFFLESKKVAARKAAEAKFTEEFGRNVPSDPDRFAIIKKNANHHLRLKKAELKRVGSEKNELMRGINRRDFLSDDETDKHLQQLDDFDQQSADLRNELVNKIRIAEKVVPVYVTAD
jgi:hypothetical protein